MKKLISSLAALMILVSVGYAQPLRNLTPDKKLKVAEEQLAKGDYYNALEWFNDVYEDDQNNLAVIHNIAQLHYMLRDMKKAESWYRKAVRKDKKGTYPSAPFTYGRILKMNGKLDDARSQFEDIISNSDNEDMKTLAASELAGIELAEELEEDKDVTVADAGENINSPYTDFSPVYGSDGNMYYAAMVSEEVVVLDGKRTDYFAKIYTASKSGDSFGKGTALDKSINKPGIHTGNVSFSPDGNRMYFTRTEMTSNSMASSEIFVSSKSGSGWGAAEKIDGIGGDYLVRQPAVGMMFGEEVLFFSSNRSGGQGGWDLYYSKIDGNSYGSPVNLGKTINTLGDELTPFYRDGSLYFSSTGHPGIGGLDVFSSAWTGSWEEPVNVGKGINSTYDDIYFSLDDSGYNGFVVSNRPSKRSLKSKTCCDDIYTVDIKEVVLDLRALAFDGKTNKDLNGVTLQFIEMTGGAEGVTETDTNNSGNEFGFALKRDMAYKLIASKEGYKDASVEFNTTGLDETQTITKKLKLTPIPPPPPPEVEYVTVYDTIRSQTPIRLNNILYEFNDDKINALAETDLRTILDYMNSYPEMVIELGSHTDSKGSESYNQKLSQRRANSARDWLVSRGVTPNRIQSVGYGESQPVAANQFDDGTDNPEGRKLNRRTEFKIISGPKFIVSQRVVKKTVEKK